MESVWDYPRPPRLEDTTKHIEIYFGGIKIADTRRAKRVLETSHPPVYYIPTEDVRVEFLAASQRSTYCEWKGKAFYYDIRISDNELPNVAWYYPSPNPPFEAIRNFIAFYPSKMESCFVDGERVRSQSGNFYGGWITGDISGPFKGGSGTSGW